MTQKFNVPTQDGFADLEYDDVTTKKLTGACLTTNVKSLAYAGSIAIVLAIVVIIYDFFKDLGRSVSATRDLFNGKEGGVAKYVGFTKGNITRIAMKVGLVILAFVLFYLSSAMGRKVCYNRDDKYYLGRLESIIKYNQEGKPIEIVIPK